MAEDKYSKTEAPTAKKKKDSRKEGKAVRSEDLVTWMSVLVATVVIPGLIGNVSDVLTDALASASDMASNPTDAELPGLVGNTLVDVFLALAPAMVALMAIAVLGNLAQVGFLLTGTPLKPKWSHLNPIKGIKRLFSARNLWQTANAVIKLMIICAVSWVMVKGISDQLINSPTKGIDVAVAETAELVISLVRAVAACALSLGLADYAFQRWQMMRDLKMSKQEIKQESRDSDGDPMLKQKQRQMGMAISGNRMLAAVSDADVVITNPTHLAIAISYAPGGGAPKVVARGADDLAGKIRERGREARVPMVESKPLARALYLVCRPGEEIPLELYQGVATVLAFLQRLGAASSPMGGRLTIAVPDSWTPSEGELKRVPPARRKALAKAATRAG